MKGGSRPARAGLDAPARALPDRKRRFEATLLPRPRTQANSTPGIAPRRARTPARRGRASSPRAGRGPRFPPLSSRPEPKPSPSFLSANSKVLQRQNNKLSGGRADTPTPPAGGPRRRLPSLPPGLRP